MPANLTDVSAFTDPVQVPADTDAADLTYLLTAFQALANRTRSLLNQANALTAPSVGDNVIIRTNGDGTTLQGSGLTLDDSDEFVYATGKPRTTILPGALFHPKTSAGNFSRDAHAKILASNTSEYHADVSQLLPDGAVVTRIRVMVTPGTSRTAGNRMQFGYSRAAGMNFSTLASGTITVIASGTEDDGTNALQLFDSDAVASLSETVNKGGGSSLEVFITSGADAGTNNDRIEAIEISWTDPGPRNR